jgi:hypothetical protein
MRKEMPCSFSTKLEQCKNSSEFHDHRIKEKDMHYLKFAGEKTPTQSSTDGSGKSKSTVTH